MFTAEHYNKIAEVMNIQTQVFEGNHDASIAIESTIRKLAIAFNQDNENFKSDLFYKAAGLK